MNRLVDVAPSPALAAAAAARRFVACARDATAAHGAFRVALSGGHTPAALYACLAADPFRAQVDWARVHIVWGDERCVPPDDPASNYRMAREQLLDHVPIPATQVHRMLGEAEPAHAAAAYERELRALLATPTGPPRATPAAPAARFDLVLLGLGEDGHTASLFPGSAALRQADAWVATASASSPPVERITLTPPLINASAEVHFLVVGPAKAAIVRGVLEGPRRANDLPAQLVAPVAGEVRWFLDTAAAAHLAGHGRD